LGDTDIAVSIMKAMTNSTRQEVLDQLRQLLGLPLSAARRAADMRTLQFGPLREVDRGSVGDFALHILCPWRLEGPDGIITGQSDVFEPIERSPEFDFDNWDYERSGNLQDSQFEHLLRRQSEDLVVQEIDADDFGGAVIHFRNHIVLRIFPSGTRGEDWRLFRPGRGSPHFVIAEGAVDHED